jgi:crotonobetainyl-CoA:carnitine CoA-transferase CaiB-like acyl-CoA transferase
MQAFEGIRVLDFTHVYAGPFATFQLGVQGAEVIKIEHPQHPDMMRSEGVDSDLNQQGLGTSYLFNNQGKKSICIDLTKAAGRKIAAELIATADVLVENYAQGLGCFGLGYENAREINAQLIYCEMNGFGSGNPFEGRPAYDAVIQAACGMMSLNGDVDQEFLRVGPPLIDYGTGAQAAFAIASALYQRSRTGKGQLIEVNMFDAALMMMSPQVSNAIHSGTTDPRTGNVQTSKPGYAVFHCQDADLMVGAFTIAQHGKLFTVLSLTESIDIPESFDHYWLAENGSCLRGLLLDRLATKNAAEWETVLNQHDVPAARVRDLHEMLSNDQPQRAVASRHKRISSSDLTAPIAGFRFASDGPRVDFHCARSGENTASVLAELGYTPTQIDRLESDGVC